MDSSKKDAITDDSPALGGDPKVRSVPGLNSASSGLSLNAFRQGIDPRATSTPYPPDEREKSSRLPLEGTPVHALFHIHPPKQDPTLAEAGLKLRKPTVNWSDEEESRDRSTSPPEPKRRRPTPYKKNHHQSQISFTDEQEEELSTTQDQSSRPSESKSLHETFDNHGPWFAEVPDEINMEPHISPSRTPVFPLGRGAHAEATHINFPEPIDPTASPSRVSGSPSRWSEGFRNDTKTLAGCEEDSRSSVKASALVATMTKGNTAATEAEANYLARSALYYSSLQGAINKQDKAGASACEVEAAIGAKKQQLGEAMRGIDGRYQSVLEKLKKPRQVPVPLRLRR